MGSIASQITRSRNILNLNATGYRNLESLDRKISTFEFSTDNQKLRSCQNS